MGLHVTIRVEDLPDDCPRKQRFKETKPRRGDIVYFHIDDQWEDIEDPKAPVCTDVKARVLGYARDYSMENDPWHYIEVLEPKECEGFTDAIPDFVIERTEGYNMDIRECFYCPRFQRLDGQGTMTTLTCGAKHTVPVVIE